MTKELLIFVATSDISGRLRGKAFPQNKLKELSDEKELLQTEQDDLVKLYQDLLQEQYHLQNVDPLKDDLGRVYTFLNHVKHSLERVKGLAEKTGKRLSQQMEGLKRGVSWSATNANLTCFNSLATNSHDSSEELVLIPDLDTRTFVDFGNRSNSQHLILSNIYHLDGRTWECCTRSLLQSAMSRFERLTEATLYGALTHQFQIKGAVALLHSHLTYGGFRHQQAMGEMIVDAMRQTGVEAYSFLKEQGENQYEMSMKPVKGVQIADAAAIFRELVYAVASSFDTQATFTPVRDLDQAGNGVQIHLSFLSQEDEPLAYSPNRTYNMSQLTEQFVAGLLNYLPQIMAFIAPSAISHLNYIPRGWGCAFNNLGYSESSSVRICPTSQNSLESAAHQFHFEVPIADATASPHLALAAIVHAGCQGIEDNLSVPKIYQDDLSLLKESQLREKGLTHLPFTLSEALEKMMQSEHVKSWFSPNFVEVYHQHKLGELKFLEGKSLKEQCNIYKQVY